MWRFTLLFLLLPLIAVAQSDSVPEFGAVYSSPTRLDAIPVAPTSAADRDLPPSQELKYSLHEPLNQMPWPSCTAFAVALAISQANRLASGNQYDRQGVEVPSTRMSPGFIFSSVKQEGGPINCDTGISIPDALDFVSVHGVATLATVPYPFGSCAIPVSPAARKEAEKHKIASYDRLPYGDAGAVKYQIARLQRPVIMAMYVNYELYANGGLHTGNKPYIWSPPMTTDPVTRKKSVDYAKLDNYHSVVCDGYDNKKHLLRMVSSWGKNWGSEGRFYIADTLYDELVKEAFVITLPQSDSKLLPNVPAKVTSINNEYANFIKPGYYCEYGRLRMGVIAFKKSMPDRVQVSFTNKQANSKNSSFLKKDSTYVYDTGEEKVFITFQGKGPGGRNKLTKAAWFKVVRERYAKAPDLAIRANDLNSETQQMSSTQSDNSGSSTSQGSQKFRAQMQQQQQQQQQWQQQQQQQQQQIQQQN